MAIIGRTLEAQGFRVGIIAQPDLDATPKRVSDSSGQTESILRGDRRQYGLNGQSLHLGSKNTSR